MQLIYTNSGLDLLALASNGVHKLWKWQPSERNPSGKSTASVVPQLWQPTNGAVMSNDVNKSKPAEESAACIALPKHDGYFMSVSGGKVSLFRMAIFKVITTFMPPPPAATYLAFSPRDNNIIAIGREDSVIQIYNVRADEIIIELRGHQKQITGLSFSWNLLISSGADAQAIKEKNIAFSFFVLVSIFVCFDSRYASGILLDGIRRNQEAYSLHLVIDPSSLVGETKVQLHNDEHHILVIHESQIGIYDDQLECLRLWSPREPLSAPISSATYSSDNLLLFTGFLDGAVGVFDAKSLRLQCRIAPSAYLSASISSSNNTTYPVVIAAHPSYPIQFALGMSDGDVYVVEKSIHI
ncbi:hypothetical protein L1887_27592 [Cichorium endivia]|nr:hypothetical protein L1887_27592 [Cichorium endivia]